MFLVFLYHNVYLQLKLCDTYGASGISLLLIGFSEAFCMGWVYGVEQVYSDLHLMFGDKLNLRRGVWPIFGVCWKFGAPLLCSATFVFVCASWTSLKYNDYEYPVWGELIGVLMAASSSLCIPLYLLGSLWNAPGKSLHEVPLVR